MPLHPGISILPHSWSAMLNEQWPSLSDDAQVACAHTVFATRIRVECEYRPAAWMTSESPTMPRFGVSIPLTRRFDQVGDAMAAAYYAP